MEIPVPYRDVTITKIVFLGKKNRKTRILGGILFFNGRIFGDVTKTAL